VPGIPAPAGSKKGFYNKKSNRVIIVDDCKRSKPWQSDVKVFARAAYEGPLLRGPLFVEMVFYMPRPKGHYGTGLNVSKIKDSAQPYPIGRPDLLKVSRACEDALTGTIYHDDSQIVVEYLTKLYEADRGPGVEILIREIM
jgi:Holliday junction resolvase